VAFVLSVRGIQRNLNRYSSFALATIPFGSLEIDILVTHICIACWHIQYFKEKSMLIAWQTIAASLSLVIVALSTVVEIINEH